MSEKELNELESKEQIEIDSDSEDSKDLLSSSVESDDGNVSVLLKKIALLEEGKQELNDRLLRKAAEFENLKRRTAREKEEAVKYGSAAILSSMLEVLDNFDRAVEMEPNADDFHSFFEGIRLIDKNLKEVLKMHGLEEINPVGEKFDPFFHEAMMREETDEVEDNTILEVFQKGYRLKDRLLRPARVKVAVLPSVPD
jgi:molecular chaperone GrpE